MNRIFKYAVAATLTGCACARSRVTEWGRGRP